MYILPACLFVLQCVMCLAGVVSTSPIPLSCVALQPGSCMGCVDLLSIIRQQLWGKWHWLRNFHLYAISLTIGSTCIGEVVLEVALFPGSRSRSESLGMRLCWKIHVAGRTEVSCLGARCYVIMANTSIVKVEAQRAERNQASPPPSLPALLPASLPSSLPPCV